MRTPQELATLLYERAKATEAGTFANDEELAEGVAFWAAVDREAADQLSKPA